MTEIVFWRLYGPQPFISSRHHLDKHHSHPLIEKGIGRLDGKDSGQLLLNL